MICRALTTAQTCSTGQALTYDAWGDQHWYHGETSAQLQFEKAFAMVACSMAASYTDLQEQKIRGAV